MTPARRRAAARTRAGASKPLPIVIAAAQQLILSVTEDDIALLETRLGRWLTCCAADELSQLTDWLTRTGPAWTRHLAGPGDDVQTELAQLARLTADAAATRTARAAPRDIRDTWHRLMRQDPPLRPADALAAARAIHAE